MTTSYKNEELPQLTEKTLEWAFSLGYSPAKSVRIAVRAMLKKGYMQKGYNLDFFAPWCLWLDLKGYTNLVTKYLPDGIREEAEKLI